MNRQHSNKKLKRDASDLMTSMFIDSTEAETEENYPEQSDPLLLKSESNDNNTLNSDQVENLQRRLAQWATRYNITDACFHELLLILKTSVPIPTLSTDVGALKRAAPLAKKVPTDEPPSNCSSHARSESCDPNEVFTALLDLKQVVRSTSEANQTSLNQLLVAMADVKQDLKDIKEQIAINTCAEEFAFENKLPFETREQLIEFEEECTNDENLHQELVKYFSRFGGSDPKVFLRNNLKKIITDECCVNFSWQGTDAKLKIRSYSIILALKKAAFRKFTDISDELSNNVIKHHFQHAKDRLNKRKSYME